jgi:hypothetical protein
MTVQAGRSTMKHDGDDGGRPNGRAAKDRREARLKLALRENLKRRKSQARERGDFTAASPISDEVGRDGGKKNSG